MSAGDMAALEQNTLAGLELDSRAIDHLPEAMLISRLRARDLTAFEELVALFERPVYSLCFRLLGDPEEARDATQETFLKVYRGLGGFRGEAGLKTWHRDKPGNESETMVAPTQTRRDHIAGHHARPKRHDDRQFAPWPRQLAGSASDIQRTRAQCNARAGRDQGGVSDRADAPRD